MSQNDSETVEQTDPDDAPQADEGTPPEEEDGLMVPAAALHEARAQAAEYLEMAQRARADLENYRRRAQRELEQSRSRAQGELLKEILNPLDDLDRALDSADSDADFETLKHGLTLVRDSLWKSFATLGLERIDADPGVTFDPNIHEAMVQTPHPDIPAGAIVEEIQPGYRLGEVVLRASRVVVSAGPPATEEPAAEA